MRPPAREARTRQSGAYTLNGSRERSPLAYERTGGPGDPLFLVHGGWEDRSAWDPLLPLLGTGFEVVSFDRRGHGRSPRPSAPSSTAEEAADLARLLEATDLYPAHLAAHASASALVLRLAADRPELVRSVLVHEPPFLSLLTGAEGYGPTVAGVTGALHEAARRVRSGDGAGGARAYLAVFGSPAETWERTPPDAIARWTRNALPWAEELADERTVLSAPHNPGDLGVPVLVTVGEESPSFSREIGRRLAELLPNGSASELPRCGHFPHIFGAAALTGTWAGFLLDRNVAPT